MLMFLYLTVSLQDYLTEQGLSEQDLLQRCLLKLDSKEYTLVGEYVLYTITNYILNKFENKISVPQPLP